MKCVIRWGALLATAGILGLYWNLGTNLGMAFCFVLRPAVLAILAVVLWRGTSWGRTMLPLSVSILLTSAVAALTYALQTDPWYVTSDAETQVWLLMELASSLIVAAVASAVVAHTLNRNRVEDK